MYILAHDLGTSGNKATLFDESGLLIASRTAAYPTDYASGNRAEQNPCFLFFSDYKDTTFY